MVKQFKVRKAYCTHDNIGQCEITDICLHMNEHKKLSQNMWIWKTGKLLEVPKESVSLK